MPKGLRGVSSNGLGRVGDLGSGSGELLDRRGGLGDCGGLLGGAGCVLFRRRQQLVGASSDLLAAGPYLLDEGADDIVVYRVDAESGVARQIDSTTANRLVSGRPRQFCAM